MRIIKWVLGILVVLVVVFVVVGFILPRDVQVARSITINAPAAEVFPHVNSLQAGEAWSPWLDRDPDVKLSYTGPAAGVDAALEWASEMDNVGSGKQKIVESVENQKVVSDLDFGDMGTAKATFLLEASGDTTNVTWTLDTDMGTNPIGRWMGLMMDSWVGADYELGLERLKALVES